MDIVRYFLYSDMFNKVLKILVVVIAFSATTVFADDSIKNSNDADYLTAKEGVRSHIGIMMNDSEKPNWFKDEKFNSTLLGYIPDMWASHVTKRGFFNSGVNWLSGDSILDFEGATPDNVEYTPANLNAWLINNVISYMGDSGDPSLSVKFHYMSGESMGLKSVSLNELGKDEENSLRDVIREYECCQALKQPLNALILEIIREVKNSGIERYITENLAATDSNTMERTTLDIACNLGHNDNTKIQSLLNKLEAFKRDADCMNFFNAIYQYQYKGNSLSGLILGKPLYEADKCLDANMLVLIYLAHQMHDGYEKNSFNNIKFHGEDIAFPSEHVEKFRDYYPENFDEVKAERAASLISKFYRLRCKYYPAIPCAFELGDTKNNIDFSVYLKYLPDNPSEMELREHAIELLGQILQIRALIKYNVEFSDEEIANAVSDIKIYMRQLGVYDWINEFYERSDPIDSNLKSNFPYTVTNTTSRYDIPSCVSVIGVGSDKKLRIFSKTITKIRNGEWKASDYYVFLDDGEYKKACFDQSTGTYELTGSAIVNNAVGVNNDPVATEVEKADECIKYLLGEEYFNKFWKNKPENNNDLQWATLGSNTYGIEVDVLRFGIFKNMPVNRFNDEEAQYDLVDEISSGTPLEICNEEEQFNEEEVEFGKNNLMLRDPSEIPSDSDVIKINNFEEEEQVVEEASSLKSTEDIVEVNKEATPITEKYRKISETINISENVEEDNVSERSSHNNQSVRDNLPSEDQDSSYNNESDSQNDNLKSPSGSSIKLNNNPDSSSEFCDSMSYSL